MSFYLIIIYMKIKNIVNYLFILFLFSLLLFFLYQSCTPNQVSIDTKKENVKDIYNRVQEKMQEQKMLAYLVIPDLNIYRPLYDIQDKRNTVEKEVMVLETSDFSNGNIALAAHSGDGFNAYFNPLDQLDDTICIYIIYKNYIYTYNLICSEEVDKTGYVFIKTYPYPTIKLITCKKNNTKKQLVYTAKLSKKEKIISSKS